MESGQLEEVEFYFNLIDLVWVVNLIRWIIFTPTPPGKLIPEVHPLWKDWGIFVFPIILPVGVYVLLNPPMSFHVLSSLLVKLTITAILIAVTISRDREKNKSK